MFTALSAEALFLASLVLFGIGAIGSLVLRKRDHDANLWGNAAALLGSLCGIGSALEILSNQSGFVVSAGSLSPLLSISSRVDALSAFFILVISMISLAASVYAFGYVRHFYGAYNIGTLGFFYNAFLAGMLLVVGAHNAVFFLVVWELMSLASFFLVIYEHKEKSIVRSGYLYFIMTHIGTAFILLSFLLLYRATGSFDFEAIKEHAGTLSPLVKNFVFLFALIGFGTKAGVIPVHIWLPRAHSAAPTHVSALMSGVMIKTGIYMLIRVCIDLLSGIPMWWGILVLVLGATSSLLGVLYALTEHDIKKLLAYHSIENIGIILLGLGSSLVFWSADMKSLAILGLAASLFHTLNHATFKALLFLGAGAVISQTHTRNMEEYGGLIRRMPQTAFFFLVGAMAISALPPLNGFFSEWATFQALFYGIRAMSTSAQWAFMIGAASLAFTGGLAAACFVKAFGATFLARPRSTDAAQAHDVGMTLRIAMAFLAALTAIIGFFAGPIFSILAGAAGSLSAFHSASQPAFSSRMILFRTADGFATVSNPVILIGVVAAILLTYAFIRWTSGSRKITIGRTWDCGTTLGSRMEITATGFSRSIITIFRGILRPTKQTAIEYRDADMRYFPKTNAVHLGIQDVYMRYFYRPMQDAVTVLSTYFRKIQLGNINVYILYIFLALLVVIFLLVI
jgi:hydrogenase-4 component B